MYSDSLIKAIEEPNIQLVKTNIFREINSDRNNKSFSFLSSCEFAKEELAKKGVTLFDEDDGQSHFVEDSTKWDKDLWQELRVDLEYNFSEKKIKDIARVMQFLRDQGHPDFQVIEKKDSDQQQHNIQKETDSERQGYKGTKPNSNSKVFISSAIGGAGGFVVGALAGKVIGFTLGGIIGGLIVGNLINNINDKADEG